MKKKRHAKILELIRTYPINTQEGLLEHLRAAEFDVTQATISRDTREMKLQKVAGSGGKYKYPMPRQAEHTLSQKFRNLLIETVEHVEAANNIVVVRTCAGMASGAAAAIDSMGHDDLLGSVAGDDTVIIVMRTNDTAAELVEELREIVGEVK
jgi:transcriptional regulator of arginine metabolism